MTKSDLESRRRKRVREGIIEPRPAGNKNKKARPVIVQQRWRAVDWFGHWLKERRWHKTGSYRDMDTALETMAKLAHKCPYFEYRIKPKEEHE